MSQAAHHHYRSDLIRIATEAMIDRGLEPEFPAVATAQLSSIDGPGRDDSPDIRAALVLDRQ